MEQGKLFQSAKYCKNCGKILFENWTKDICNECETALIFDDVREYIRSNEVNEYDVAAHFDIPLSMVQHWIKEGRIEYKERDEKTIFNTFCQRCGVKVTFGTLCQKCLKEMNGQKKGYSVKPVGAEAEGKIRFLENVADEERQ